MAKAAARVAIPTVICVALCLATWYLLGPSGPVQDDLSQDLSFLITPLVGFFILLLAGWLAGALVAGLPGRIMRPVLLGIAFAYLAYALSGEAPRISEPPWVAHLSDIRYWTALGITGVTVSWLTPQLAAEEGTRRAQPAATALGLFIVGLSLWRMLVPFAQFVDPLDGIGVVVFVAFGLTALSSLASYGLRARNPFIADACRWATESQLRNFVLGAVLGSYFVFIRPAIVRHFEYAPLVEWAIVCLAVWRLFRGVRSRLEDQHAYSLKFSDWEKHAQQQDRKVDHSFTYLAAAQEAFVELGDRSRLLIQLVLLLDRGQFSKERIHNALRPLVHYREESVPRFAFGWEQGRIRKRARKHRKKILDQIVNDIAERR